MELSPYYQKDLDCIYCKKKFKTTKVRTKFIKVEGHDTDFRPIYENEEVNPLFYNIFVCEHCGFSFSDDFTKYFAPGLKEVVQKEIKDKWMPRSYGEVRSIQEGILSYKLGIYCGTLKKEKFVSIAGLALRTAWLYRMQYNADQEKRFLRLARDWYVESYSADDFRDTQMSETRMLYLIGELSRKLDDIDTATRYFSKVIEKQRTSTETKVVEMAKDRWQEIRSMKEKEAIT